MAGRERQHDYELDGVPYRALRDKNGVPIYREESIAETAGMGPGREDEPRQWSSFHSGMGYSHFLVPNTYFWGENIDPSFPRQVTMGPYVQNVPAGGTMNTSHFFEQSGALYALCGRYCRLISLGGNTTTVAKDFGPTVTASVGVNFDASTVIFFSSDTAVYTFNGTTFTQATGSSVKGNYGAKFWADNAGAYSLARSYTSSSNPVLDWLAQGGTVDSGSWGAAYVIGDQSSTVTAVTAYERRLFIGKTDGLYMLESNGRGVRLFEVPPVATNGQNTMVDEAGIVWYPSSSGFFRYDPSTGAVNDVTPGRGLGNTSPIFGRVTAQTTHRGWHYIVLWNGTNSYLMKGRRREDGEPGIGPMVWHGALAKLAGQQVSAMHVSHLTTPSRLYMGYGGDVVYVRLARDADNPLSDPDYKYATSGKLYLPSDNWGVPGMLWQPMGFALENSGLNSDTIATVYAAIDQGDYQVVGVVQEGGRAPVNMPPDGDWRFSEIALRIDFTTPDSVISPVVRSFSGRAARRARLRDLISTQVFCSDVAASRYGIHPRFSGLAQLQHLKRLQSGKPAELVDFWTGSAQTRRVLVLPVATQVVVQQNEAAAELVAVLGMEVLGDDVAGVTAAYNARYGTAIYGKDRYSVVSAGDIIAQQVTTTARYGTAIYGKDRYS